MQSAQHYALPQSIDEALALVRSRPGKAAFLAGGTALALRADPDLETLVDIMGLGLDRVESTPTGLRLGATTALERLRRHESIQGLGNGIMAAALAGTRTEAWRNQATLAGRLREASPADLVTTVLLALEATLTLCTAPRGAQFIRPVVAAAGLGPADLILHVEVPASTGWSHALQVLRISALDPAVVAVAVAVRPENGTMSAVRVAACGLLPRPSRLPLVEAALSGLSGDDGFESALAALARSCRPSTDLRATAAYRAHLGQVLLGRALRQAWRSS